MRSTLCSLKAKALLLWNKLTSMKICKRKNTGYYGDGAYHVFKNVTSHAAFTSLTALDGFDHNKYKDEWHSLGIAPDRVAMSYPTQDKQLVYNRYILDFLLKEGYIEELNSSFKLTEKGRVAQAIGTHEEYVKYYTKFQRAYLKQPSFNFQTRQVTWVLSIISILVSFSVTFYKITEINKIKSSIEKLNISDSIQHLIISGEVTIPPKSKDANNNPDQIKDSILPNRKNDSI